MPPRLQSEWKKISDFSPGIRQTVSPNHPLGTAQENNTYRCHSIVDGALAPLPRLKKAYYHETPYVAPATASDMVSEQVRVVGIHVNSPVYWGGEGLPGVYQDNSEIYLAMEWWDNKNGGHVNWRVDRYFRNYANTPHWETLWTTSESQVFSSLVRPKRAEFISQRSNHGHKLTLGPSVIAWVLSGWAQQFPDETNPLVNGTVALPGDRTDPNTGGFVFSDGIVAHQGRAVIFPVLFTGMGTNQIMVSNEAFYWTVANDLRTLGTSQYYDETLAASTNQYFTSAVFTEEPTGYGVYQSLSADELLLIKARQGAVIIRGSLDDFTSVNYPFVRGTGQSLNRGCNSPKGFVYPTDAGGIWLWSGGEFSEHLTKHMTADFWRPPAVAPAQGDSQTDNLWGWDWTKCDQWNQFVMFPNNWLWDTDFDGWWRIDNTDDYVIHKWASDARGLSCYGTPSGFRNQSDPAFYEFTKIDAASSYSWQSHPLPASIEDRDFMMRDFVLVATGLGTVKVTLTSMDVPNGQSMTFDVTQSSLPVALRTDFGIQGSHVTIRLESAALNDSDNAPIIHEIRWREEVRARVGSVD